MTDAPEKIPLALWSARYELLKKRGMIEPEYGGPLDRHVAAGDTRLGTLAFDNSPAALRLWNFLLTEEERLKNARARGDLLIGAMKDLGTVPVMAYSLAGVRAFYPDGAWWIPCVMETNDGLLRLADGLGVNESFCPARAMLGAFVSGAHFPLPDFSISSVGAVCDDFSAIAQRLCGMGHPILFWNVPQRRKPDPGEKSVRLARGLEVPEKQLHYVRSQLANVRRAIENACGKILDDQTLAAGIAKANRSRRLLRRLRELAYSNDPCPLPALEMLIAEMLIIHFCSDIDETENVLAELLDEAAARVAAGTGVTAPDAARIFWVNPTADLKIMNLLEDAGGRLAGTEYLFRHAIDDIDETCDPLTALAKSALADPMVGPARERAEIVVTEIERFGVEGVIVSRIPGASHCATESVLIRELIEARCSIPCVEIEVSPLSDAAAPNIANRLQGIVETVKGRRK